MSTRTPRNAARLSAVIERHVRQKIRREDLDGCLRLGQRRQQRPARLFKIGVRAVGDGAGDDVAGWLQFGKPDFAVEHFAGGERPVVGEGLLQLGDDRAGDAEMQILHGLLGLVGQDVAVADVHAAGEGDVGRP